MREAVQAAFGGLLVLGGFCLPFAPFLSMPEHIGLLMIAFGVFLNYWSIHETKPNED